VAIVFKAVMRVHLEMVATFVQALLSAALSNWPSFHFADVELALYLLHVIGEVKADLPRTYNNTFKSQSALICCDLETFHNVLNAFLTQAIIALISSNIFKHPHKVVVIRTFEVQ
jgi:hypothetical protein